jgi:hypothetical protein
MPVIAIGEGDGLLLRINGDNAAIAQRDAVGVVCTSPEKTDT